MGRAGLPPNTRPPSLSTLSRALGSLTDCPSLLWTVGFLVMGPSVLELGESGVNQADWSPYRAPSVESAQG